MHKVGCFSFTIFPYFPAGLRRGGDYRCAGQVGFCLPFLQAHERGIPAELSGIAEWIADKILGCLMCSGSLGIESLLLLT